MSDLRIRVVIDGQEYTREQIERYEYERMLHGLHELKRLGATVKDDNGNDLSHEDINWLEPDVAKAISLEVRTGLGEQEMLELMAPVAADAARRWKRYNEVPIEQQGYHHASTFLSVRGLALEDFVGAMAMFQGDAALKVMPEHYMVIGSILEGQRGMEPFGMFGEPPLVTGVAAPDIPAAWKLQPAPGYASRVAGEFHLAEDGTPIHVGAAHELNPVEDGFDMKSTFVCPANSPYAIAQGHTIHFAIEISNLLRNTYEALTSRA